MHRIKAYIVLRKTSLQGLCLMGLICAFMMDSMAQTTYKMGNNKVYNCRAKLTDSEGNLQSAKKYANNENYTFTVCVKGASSIDIKFNGPFCTESITDYLKVYKGKDTFGTLIRTYSGTINSPVALSISDSCVTFFFHSDINIVCDGWDLNWEAKITSVPQPVFSPITDPTCNSTKIRVTLDQKFNCDSVKAKNFKLSGALSTAVSSAVGVNCDSKNETNTFDLTFVSGLNKSGSYTLNFNSSFKDACDSIWLINAKLIFKITDCPITVLLFSNKYVICKGSCANLTSFVTGGNVSNYAYTWISGGLTGAPPKTVCPTVNTQYILRVTDGVSVPGMDTVDIVVLDPPVAQNDTTVCQSSGAFNLTASPAGGNWSGTGITSGPNGTFNPGVSGGGTFKVFYNIGACRDSVIITVKPINAGPPLAACPGSAPFNVTGFTPPGGTWSGPNITTAGVITPPGSPGTFKVTYSWNGCTSDKTINIDGIVMTKADTICRSKALDTFKFYPVGGFWTGPGLTNALKGINSPPTAGAGNKLYIYSINGCKDTLKRNIQDVDARWDEIACPDAGQRTLPAGLPAGGKWTGKGIFDPVLGVFDADSFKVPGKSTFVQVNLTYEALNGCKDDKIMYLRYTRFYKDTVKNCVSDTAYYLRYQYVYSDPWNMDFTGSTAIVGTQLYYQKFSPAKAGRGTWHEIIGDANGCKDTIIIHVYPRAKIQNDTTFCIADDPYKLYNGEGSGFFFGKGITNGFTGMFSPAVADTGTHLIFFSMFGKCKDTLRIRVNPLPKVTMTGLQSAYCMRDTLVTLILSPLGGTLTGKGTSGAAFNPKSAGTGMHLISYTYGAGKCINKSQKTVTVGDTLKMSMSSDKDTICIGTTVALTAKSSGGTGNYDLKWSSGQTNVEAIYMVPKVPTIYRAILKDGCSDSVEKTRSVYVHPRLFGSVASSPIQCYGNQGFTGITMGGVGPYKYLWNTIPPQTTPNITAAVGTTYRVYVTNTKTGCTYDTFATIPGYSRIRAYFTTSPAGQCVYSNNARIQIINMSEGGTEGGWDFGDKQSLPYDPLTNPSHTYEGDTDIYTIRLVIQNEGKCKDSFSVNICVLDTITLFIPNAFTPNDDATNDVFRIEATSVSEATIEIYNRWGEMMFWTNDARQGWNGYYQGKLCPTDYYVYLIKYKGKKTPWKYQKGYFYLLK